MHHLKKNEREEDFRGEELKRHWPKTATLHSSLLCLNRLVWVRYYSKNKALENCIRKCSFTNLTVLEVVVAQVLNNGIMSEQAGFECHDRLGLFWLRIAVDLFSGFDRLFLITSNRTMHTLPTSILFPFINYHCKNYQLGNLPRKGKS